MLTGSPGGRETANTVRAALARGLRFGFVASSDNHSGFPGAYGEGLMAALVDTLTRPAILDALRARRTYALTGDRIEIDLAVNGAPLGASLRAAGQVEVRYAVHGRDALDVVEIVQDGRVVDRAWGDDALPAAQAFSGPFQVRLEWGWGPWASLGLERTTDWAFRLQVEGGRLRRAFPCLASGPFDEARRHAFVHGDDGTLAVRSYTSRKQAFRGNPNHSVVLEVDGDARTAFRLTLQEPVATTSVTTAGALFDGSRPVHVGPYPAESYLWHRLLAGGATSLSRTLTLELPGGPSHVYLRVRQKNSHMAWTSPVFIDDP
jgi:hypothetical protein